MQRLVVGSFAAIVLAVAWATPAAAWDSAKFKWLTTIVHPTHSYLTEYAIDQLVADFPELGTYRAVIVEGANQELHELPVTGVLHGVDLEARRVARKGTNAGSDDMPGWWADAEAAYAAGNKERAWFLIGIMVHMIEDMGVPAHANGVYHQGTLTEFDNFEAMALQKWDPDFKGVNRTDPGYADPSAYYRFSQDWAKTDAPDYRDRDAFAKTWLTASSKEKALVRNRQGRTATVVLWALRAAATAFAMI
ncbi:MAG: hypothetical protein HY834_14970 [Devosia nanyangense]|uniref:Phospholipase C/D domain-containing protein n=1 Tax=Devosia nanyangense TaxID=1228055 RepID=A0A933NXK9_9HYPH|nr:hypothetical protein [Devosia nanyangense]